MVCIADLVYVDMIGFQHLERSTINDCSAYLFQELYSIKHRELLRYIHIER